MPFIKIKLDYDFSNLNEIINVSRRNIYMANNVKRKEMEYVTDVVKDIKPIEEYPLKLTFIWHFKSKQRDLDNCVPKSILDAMVNAKVLKNDNLSCIREINHKSIIDGKFYVELEIEEYEEESSICNL